MASCYTVIAVRFTIDKQPPPAGWVHLPSRNDKNFPVGNAVAGRKSFQHPGKMRFDQFRDVREETQVRNRSTVSSVILKFQVEGLLLSNFIKSDTFQEDALCIVSANVYR